MAGPDAAAFDMIPDAAMADAARSWRSITGSLPKHHKYFEPETDLSSRLINKTIDEAATQSAAVINTESL